MFCDLLKWIKNFHSKRNGAFKEYCQNQIIMLFFLTYPKILIIIINTSISVKLITQLVDFDQRWLMLNMELNVNNIIVFLFFFFTEQQT